MIFYIIFFAQLLKFSLFCNDLLSSHKFSKRANLLNPYYNQRLSVYALRCSSWWFVMTLPNIYNTRRRILPKALAANNVENTIQGDSVQSCRPYKAHKTVDVLLEAKVIEFYNHTKFQFKNPYFDISRRIQDYQFQLFLFPKWALGIKLWNTLTHVCA